MPMQGSSVLLVGRGSSDFQPIHELQQIGAAVEQKLSLPVSCSFLTKGTPSFTAELKTITSTASHVYVMPYLLFYRIIASKKLSCIQKKYDHVTTCNCLQFDTYMKLTLLERMEECIYV